MAERDGDAFSMICASRGVSQNYIRQKSMRGCTKCLSSVSLSAHNVITDFLTYAFSSSSSSAFPAIALEVTILGGVRFLHM